MPDYNQFGTMYTEGMLRGPNNDWAIVFDNTGQLIVVRSPFGAVQSEVIKCLSSGEVRINNRSYSGTSGDVIGFQSKPSQTVSSSGNIIGAQISPRLQSGVALTGSGSLIGFHVDTDLKGTAGGNVAGDVRGMEIEMVSDASSARTVAGNVVGIRFRTNLDATVTGTVACFQVPSGEAAGGQWDALGIMDAVTGVFDKTEAGTTGTKAGFIKVFVGGDARFIRLYDAGN